MNQEKGSPRDRKCATLSAIAASTSASACCRAAAICAGMAPADMSSSIVYRHRSHITHRHGHSRPVRNTVATRAIDPSPARSSSTITP